MSLSPAPSAKVITAPRSFLRWTTGQTAGSCLVPHIDPLHEPVDGSLDVRDGLSLAPVVSPVALEKRQAQDFSFSLPLRVSWALLWLVPRLSHQKSKRLSPALENLATNLENHA